MRDKILISLLPFPLFIPWVCSALHLGLSALWVALQVRKERHKVFHSHLADIWSSRTLNTLSSSVAGDSNLHIHLKSENVSLHSYLKTDMADSQYRGVLGTFQSSFIISFFPLKHLQLFFKDPLIWLACIHKSSISPPPPCRHILRAKCACSGISLCPLLTQWRHGKSTHFLSNQNVSTAVGWAFY